jgi:hypothetical protein
MGYRSYRFCHIGQACPSPQIVPAGKARVFGANGEFESNKYIIDIYLPNQLRVVDVLVTECPGLVDDVIIGMDIITSGDFAITHHDGKTTFSYQFPSTHHIDFVEEINKIH